MIIKKNIFPALCAGALTALILCLVRIKLGSDFFTSDRFFTGYGWIQVLIVTIYSVIIAYKLLDIRRTELWRKHIWLIFSIVFFIQFILGISIDSRFLMSGNLHLPIPMVILGGTIYRHEIGFMPVLYIVTILLTGPAWCSYFCYFGAIDNFMASGKGLRTKPVKYLVQIKITILSIIVMVSLCLRIFGCPSDIAGYVAIGFGVIGIFIILYVSKKKRKLMHCIAWCPMGTITNFLKYLSPFRMQITSSCTTCMACTLKCKYDALNLNNIKKGKPGITCTYCGDCINACHVSSINYKFFFFSSTLSRTIYFVLIAAVHSAFLSIARI